ncbi:MAG: LuxR C-terminal-related transcriptional regulator [Oscillospiraceae bacterium]|nr:LuxR C-terminal-related transcriptional regulator [Oscillospiraceae bacterium]
MSYSYGMSLGVLTETVPRTALLKKMERISAKQHIYLFAPGGYGKSVAAAQWLSSTRGKTERITVKDTDNDPRVFYTRLARTLIRLAAGEKQTLHQAVDSLDKLLEMIETLPKRNPRCHFALDDLHVLKNEEILAAIPVIVGRLPDYIRCLLAGRSEPEQGLTETGLFGVITKDDLLFSSKEIEWFGAERDRELDSERVGRLLKITGGWAMYLSAILSSPDEPENQKAGKPLRTLTQYFESRVWGQWEHETKLLLLRLSVPGEAAPELCERLTGQPGGRETLERLARKENAFLTRENDDTYRFHDIFHDFLLEQTGSFLDKDELWRLNDVAAEWYYEQGDYYTSAKHYIHNGNHEGINRCMDATTLYTEKIGGMSVLNRLDFFKQYVLSLSPDFIAASPYLVYKCAVAAYYDGDIETYFQYVDMLYERKDEIVSRYPELIVTYLFVTTIDFRVPFRQGVERAYKMMASMPRGGIGNAEAPKEAKTASITQNLPFFHRSMRDYYDYHALKESDLKILRDAFGVIIGKDYAVMEQMTIAGVRYEQGELLDAMYYAATGSRVCDGDTHPEVFFCAHAILSAVLYAMGASHEAGKIMGKLEYYIKSKAQSLRPNLKALQTVYSIRGGDTAAAREWLTVYASRSARLPFYQICRHFTTLRAHIALKDFPAAIAFGTRLLTLATEYNRPLDQIETRLLLAIALWHDNQKGKAAEQLAQAMNTAMPCGFTQLFMNEGKELLPILLEMGKREDASAGVASFAEKLKEKIGEKHGFSPSENAAPNLSGRQRDMLTYLSKGMTYSEIAAATGLARGTVKAHVLLVYKRLEVHDAEEAVVKAKMFGIL